MSSAQDVVRLEDITYRYDNEAPPALERVSAEIGAGEFVGLVGQNGSGKTTLARHLNGLLKPETGRVLVRGRDTRDVEPGHRSSTVGYVFQNPDHALFLTTVRDEIGYSLSFRKMSEEDRRLRIEQSLEAFGLRELADHHPASLGRGTRRLVILAATYAMQPDLLVLDEPTGGLDHRLTDNLVRTLQDYVDTGRSVLLISHDMQLVANTCRRVLALAAGRLVADCPTGEFFRQTEVLDTAGLRPPDVARLTWKLENAGLAIDTVSIAGFAVRFQDLAARAGNGRSG
ncbi:MAG: ABC transporter ATP-binding protein [Thermomicrobiales bacterium]